MTMERLDRLTELDILASLDNALARGAFDETTATWVRDLYGCSLKQASRVCREWNAGLEKDPRPNWGALYVKANVEAFR